VLWLRLWLWWQFPLCSAEAVLLCSVCVLTGEHITVRMELSNRCSKA
jgi:hypothetical protein